MTKSLRNWVFGFGAVIGALWFVKYVSESEMRRLDAEVDRLCAIDGRSVIFETVKLPANKFDVNGRVLIPQSGKDDTNFGYYGSFEQTNLAGPGQPPGARLLRTVYRIVRSADNKVMAEHLYYTRGAGTGSRAHRAGTTASPVQGACQRDSKSVSSSRSDTWE